MTAKKCTKSVMHAQSCCFANLSLLLSSRSRRRRPYWPTFSLVPWNSPERLFAKVNLTICLLVSKVVNTTYPSSFNNFCYHDNNCTVLLPDHPPKITDGVGHGSWNTGENKTRTVNYEVVSGVKHATILLNEVECETESVFCLKYAKCLRSYKSTIQELFLIFIQNNSYFKNILTLCTDAPSPQ